MQTKTLTSRPGKSMTQAKHCASKALRKQSNKCKENWTAAKPPWQGQGRAAWQSSHGGTKVAKPPWQGQGGRAKVAKPPWQGQGGKATMAGPGWQGQGGKATIAGPGWQGQGGKATMAVPGNQMYIKKKMLTAPLLSVWSQLCFGSRRANLGMPGDLVIQERLVALK